MLGEEVERPGWDQAGLYKPANLSLYFEDQEARLVAVEPSLSLAQALTLPGHLVKGGTPAFIVLARGGEFAGKFLAKYTLVN